MEKRSMLKLSTVPFLFFICSLLISSLSPVKANTVSLACNEFPPHKMEKNIDGLKGFDVDFLEAAFSRSNIQTEIYYYPWKRAFSLVEKGSLDGLCSCSKSPDREKLFFYSQELGYVSSGLFAFTPEINSFDENNILNSIAGKTVGVGRGYTLTQNLVDAGVRKIQEVRDDAIGVKMLSSHRFDYYYGYHAPTMYQLKSLDVKQKIYYREISRTPYFTCFSKAIPNGKKLRDLFDKGLAEIRRDGTYHKILQNYR